MSYWYVANGHPPNCHCHWCCFINEGLYREAEASVALDHDKRVQTISLPEGSGDD